MDLRPSVLCYLFLSLSLSRFHSVSLSLTPAITHAVHTHTHAFFSPFLIFPVVVVTARTSVLATASHPSPRHDLVVPTNELLSRAKREFINMGNRPSRSVFDNSSSPSRHNTDWMSRIPDHVSLANITIPGTHNTMAHHGGDMAECQAWLLYAQLQAGIRYLDIRCRHYRNGLPIHHGLKYQHADFPMVLRETARFLEEYPSEAVIMRVKKEFQSAENTQAFEETFWSCIEEYMASDRLWTDLTSIPKLGDTRGRIVILQDFRGSPLGLDYNGIFFSVEDRWKVPTLLDMHIDRKWDYIKRKLDIASQNEDLVGE